MVEQESNDLSFGVGYSMQEGVIGDISLTERNFLGNGQWLRLKLEGSLTRLQAEVGFTEPRFLGTNLAAGFDLFYKDVDYTTQASYMSQKIGGTLRARYPINEEWSAGVNYTFVRNKLYDVGANASAAIKEAVPGFPDATSIDLLHLLGRLLAHLRHARQQEAADLRRLLHRRPGPRRRRRRRALLAVGGRGARLLRRERGRDRHGRATGGIITGWGGQDVRLLDLFYRGGETVRGFATAGIGPRDTQSVNQDALGGRIYYGTSAELLFAIPGVPEDIGLRGAVFADAGSLWSTNSTAAACRAIAGNTPALRASVGVGLAWDSPLGNLRVDYAFPVVEGELRQDPGAQLRPEAILSLAAVPRGTCRSRAFVTCRCHLSSGHPAREEQDAHSSTCSRFGTAVRGAAASARRARPGDAASGRRRPCRRRSPFRTLC